MKKNYQHQHFPVHGYTIWQRIPQACKKSEKILMQPIVTCAGCGKRIVPQKRAYLAAMLSATLSFGIGIVAVFALNKAGAFYIGLLLFALILAIFDLVVPALIFAAIPWKEKNDGFTEEELQNARFAKMARQYRETLSFNLFARITIARISFMVFAKIMCDLFLS